MNKPFVTDTTLEELEEFRVPEKVPVTSVAVMPVTVITASGALLKMEENSAPFLSV